MLLLATLCVAATPTLLRGDTAADIATTHSILRSVATALQSYRVDYSSYPACHRFGVPIREGAISESEPALLERLTTPVSYIAAPAPPLPFAPIGRTSNASAAGTASDWANGAWTMYPPFYLTAPGWQSFFYQSFRADGRVQTTSDSFEQAFHGEAIGFHLLATGPTGVHVNTGGIMSNSAGGGSAGSMFGDCLDLIYDPTNGLDSIGMIAAAEGELGGDYARQFSRAIRAAQFAPSAVGAEGPAGVPPLLLLR
jgi:hypothetical protein